MLRTYSMTFDGRLLTRGFWLYVWEIKGRLSHHILYQAWVEARNCSEHPQRIFDLADAMHNAPALLLNYDEHWLRCFREDLVRYEAKHSPIRSYVAYLDDGIPDLRQWLWLPAAPGAQSG